MNVRVVAGLCLAASVLRAADGPHFDAASARPASADAPSGCKGGPGTPSPGRLTCGDATLAMLISLAYDARPDRISGPEWITRADNGFEIEAAIPPGSSPMEFRQMLRNLLTERFHLVLRQESRQTDVYALRVSAKGATLKEGKTQIPPIMDRVLNGQVLIEGRGTSIGTLAAVLTKELRSPVSDETKMLGTYDFVLIAGKADAMQLGRALEDQLGLQLAATKVAAPIFIVQEALKKPSEK